MLLFRVFLYTGVDKTHKTKDEVGHHVTVPQIGIFGETGGVQGVRTGRLRPKGI